jgi:tripartite-type tricarboxylate transporter receptor subunit TctC
MSNRREFIQSTIGAAILGSTAFQQAWAQSGMPIEQVKVLYGFPPGSSGDICARRVAEKFGGTPYSKNAGIIDSRPGAGGQIALNLLKTLSEPATPVFTPCSYLMHTLNPT